MDGRVFVFAAAMLSFCPGIFGDSKLKTVRVLTGESVILPCIADIFDDTTTVEWSKEGMAQHVLVYRQGCEIHKEKHPVFLYRSSLIMNELKNRNISVRISDVKLSDAGNYTCMTIHKKIPRSTVIELIVGAVSEPKLSVVPSSDAGVTLQCEVPCWFPKPYITFLDGAGKEISAQNEKFEQRSQGCFSVRRRVTLQTTTNSVTCKVNERYLNQSKAENFIMPDVCLTSCTNTIIIIVAIIEFVCGLILCAALFYVKYKNGQKPSVLQKFLKACAACWSSAESLTDDNSSPITKHPADNEEVHRIEMEQPNEETSRLSPCEVNGDVSGSSQVLAQGLSTQIPHVVLAAGAASDRAVGVVALLTRSSGTRPNNTGAYRRHTYPIRHSSSPPKLSEEAETLLPPKKP